MKCESNVIKMRVEPLELRLPRWSFSLEGEKRLTTLGFGDYDEEQVSVAARRTGVTKLTGCDGLAFCLHMPSASRYRPPSTPK